MRKKGVSIFGGFGIIPILKDQIGHLIKMKITQAFFVFRPVTIHFQWILLHHSMNLFMAITAENPCLLTISFPKIGGVKNMVHVISKIFL